MKGSIVAVGDFPDGTATASRLRLIARALAEENFDMTVAILQPTLKKAIPSNTSVKGQDGPVCFVYLNGRTVRPSGLFSAMFDTLRGMIRSVVFAWQQKRQKADFLIIYSPYFSKFAPLFLSVWLLRIPTFFEVCEISSTLTKRQKVPLNTRLVVAADKLNEYIAPRLGKGIIPISSGILQRLKSRGATDEQMFLLPILVDADLYAEPSKDPVSDLVGTRYFFNSGKFLEKDGLEFVVRAFEKTALGFPDVLLAFSGLVNDAERERIAGYLNDSTIAQRVVFTGFLSREQLIWCYQNAAASLSCRSNSVYANFGFPTKLAEYMAAGSPVLATTVGDTDLYLTHGDNARLAQPEDAASIADEMRWMLQHPEECRAIGSRGKVTARKNFHYKSHAKALVAFIASRSGTAVNSG